MKVILTIEDVFDISGVRCLVTSDVPPDLGFRAKPNDPIQLRTPEGHVLDTHIVGFMSGRPAGSSRRFYDIVLPNTFSKCNVPIGTEVWLLTLTSDRAPDGR